MTDPAAYPHFLEDRATPRVRSFIAERRASIEDVLRQPGMGGRLNCLQATSSWIREFEAVGIRAVHLGQATDNTVWKTGGGYLLPGETEPRDHQWLAVGDNLALFDPTAAQYSYLGTPSLDRYITFDGRPFEDWRRDELAAGRGQGPDVGWQSSVESIVDDREPGLLTYLASLAAVLEADQSGEERDAAGGPDLHTMASMKERAVSRGRTAERGDHRRVGSLAAGTRRWSIWPGIYSRVFMVVMRPGAAQSRSRPSGEAMPYGERALDERDG